MKYLFILILFVGCTTTKTPDAVPVEDHKMTLSWTHQEWTDYLVNLVYVNFDVLSKAQDITKFCNKFKELTKKEQVQAISEIFVGVMYFESGWNPNSRFEEKSMGIDPITKNRVFSEGLFQLSYQDVRGYPFCEFNWTEDKNLPIDKRSITDPYKNLSCGVGIMAKQISKKGSFGTEKSYYWSVLRLDSKYNLIAARVQKNVEACK